MSMSSPLRTAYVVAVSVAAAASVAGCASSGRTTPATTAPASSTVATSTSPVATGPADAASVPIGAPGSPRGHVPSASEVNGTNASAVANAYVITAWSQDTRLDRSPNDAARRATRWTTSQLAQVYATALPGDGGANWSALRAADGYTTVKAVEMPNEASQSPTRTQRFENVTMTEHDKGGAVIAQPEQFVATVTLTRAGTTAPWRVKAVTQQ